MITVEEEDNKLPIALIVTIPLLLINFGHVLYSLLVWVIQESVITPNDLEEEMGMIDRQK